MNKKYVNSKKHNLKKGISKGIVHISATFNNTTVSVSDDLGNVLCWTTAGVQGFKGSKKSTPYAAQQAIEAVMLKVKEYGIREVGIKVQGPGSGREAAIKSVGSIENVRVLWLKDVTPLPHNGCRPPKRRRV